MDIEEKIQQLPPEKQKEFRVELKAVCNDKGWLYTYGLSYTNLDVPKIKEVLFREEYEKYLPKAS